MRKTIYAILILALSLPALAMASGDVLTDLAARINVSAGADFGMFRTRVAAEFGVGEPRIEAAVKAVGSAGEAYLCFRIGQMTGRDFDEVIRVYNSNKKKGWGFVAKEMGIKPGSPEFHALKDGKYVVETMGEKGGKEKPKDDKAKGGSDDKGKGGKEKGGPEGKSKNGSESKNKGGKGK